MEPYINKTGKKLAVIGSRTFSDKEKLYRILDENLGKIKMIVSGGANGPDKMSTDWAQDRGIPYLVFPARWKDPETGLHDKGAGFKRNYYIINEAETVLAFYDGISKGTANSLEIAKKIGKPVKVISFVPELKNNQSLP